MKTSTKVIIGIVAIISIISFLGYKKYQKLRTIFDKIIIDIAGVSGVKFTTSSLNFNANIKLTNPTPEALDANGYLVKIARINFFYDNKYIATAHPNISKLSVAANNQLIINDIPVVVPWKALLTNISQFLDFQFNENLLNVEIIISVGGSEFSIK